MAASLPQTFIEIARGGDELAGRIAEWDELSRDAIEPNVFYESGALLAAVRHLPLPGPLCCVFVYRAGAEGGASARRLIAFAPFVRVGKGPRNRLPSYRSFTHRHLKYIELDPDYRALLLECVEELRPHSERILPGTHQPEAYIFISSAGSVTPFHFDDEHNFLLQIRGWKQVHTWTPVRAGISQRDLERYYLGGHRNIPLRDEIAPLAETFRLEPGQGLHIPVHSPHWVKNGDEVSVSFSVTFRSAPLAREASIHWLNGKLRRFGLSPRPPGKALVGDGAKVWTARTTRSLLRRLRRAGVLR